MKRLLAVLALATIGFQVAAQDAAVKQIQAVAGTGTSTDSSKKPNKNGWTKGLNFSLSLTQVGNSNWLTAGDDKFTLSAATSINAFATKKWKNKVWDNILDVNYGLVRTTTLGYRKQNDRLDFISKLSIKPKKWKKFSWSLLAQLRSQITDGFDYDYFGSGTSRRTSGFFAPAYVVLAPGVEWKPNDWFSAFGTPVSSRLTITSNGPYSYASQGGVFDGNVETPLARLYGVSPVDQVRSEFGAFLTLTAKKTILKNVQYYSKMDLYSNYVDGTPGNIDLFWTNQFKVRVNKFIQISYGLDLLYDDDIKNPKAPGHALGLQVLSTLGIGFAFSL